MAVVVPVVRVTVMKSLEALVVVVPVVRQIPHQSLERLTLAVVAVAVASAQVALL